MIRSEGCAEHYTGGNIVSSVREDDCSINWLMNPTQACAPNIKVYHVFIGLQELDNVGMPSRDKVASSRKHDKVSAPLASLLTNC